MTRPLGVWQKTNGCSERSACFRRSFCRFKHNPPSLPLETGHHDQAFDDAIAESDSPSDKSCDAVMAQFLTGRSRRGDRNHTSTLDIVHMLGVLYSDQVRVQATDLLSLAKSVAQLYQFRLQAARYGRVQVANIFKDSWSTSVHYSTILSPHLTTLLFSLSAAPSFLLPPPLGTVQSRLTRWQQSTCVGSPRW